MELFNEQSGLTTFGIVLALATYTQAVSYRLLDKIDELKAAHDPQGKIAGAKVRIAALSVGDFLLVVLGWVAGFELFITRQASTSSLSRTWGLVFFITVVALSLMHGRAWKKAADVIRNL